MLNIRFRNFLLWSAVIGLGLQSCVKDDLLVTEPDANADPEEETITAINDLEIPSDFTFATSREVTVKMNNLSPNTKYNVYLADSEISDIGSIDPASLTNRAFTSIAVETNIERTINVPAYIQKLIVEEVNFDGSNLNLVSISGNEAQYNFSTAKTKGISFLKSSSTCPNGPDNDGDGICDNVDTDDDNDGISDDSEMFRIVYGFTGSDQVITVPNGAVGMHFKVWGAGGGGGSHAGLFSPGGSGGYVEGTIGVNAGSQYTLVVGEGGRSDGAHGINTTSYGFGGNADGSYEVNGGDGGGLSGIFTGSTQITETDHARAIAIAGGGGGGEVALWDGGGGAVRYATGGQGGDPTYSGGTATFRGGSDTTDATPGAGGGGGFYGGIAGSTRISSGAGLPHGEGGTNYLWGGVGYENTAFTSDLAGPNQFNTPSPSPFNTGDADYVAGTGEGSSLGGGKGGNGLIVVRFFFDDNNNDIYNHFEADEVDSIDSFGSGSGNSDPVRESVDVASTINSGFSGGVNTNDANWTVEQVSVPGYWYGPVTGGEVPAVISGPLTSFMTAPADSDWIAYNYSGANNGLGNHTDIDGDGIINEGAIVSLPTGDHSAVTYKNTFTIEAGTVDFSLNFDVAVDNYISSIRVNGIEQSINPSFRFFAGLHNIQLDSDWVEGSNTLEITVNSGPPLMGLLVTNAMATRIGDADNDGVNDYYDEYPNDVTRAFNSYYPSSDSWASVAFEDLWPFAGDYDFNDLVVEYRIKTVTNANNELVAFDYEINEVSNGAGFTNAMALRFPNVQPSNIGSVSGQLLTESLVSVAANGTESGQTDAVVFLMDNAHMYEGQGFTVTVNLSAPSTTFPAPPWDPFLVVNGSREMEVHLAGYSATDLGNGTPTVNGASNEDPDGDYQSTNGMPWAINITGSYAPPAEKTPVNEAYTYFNSWVTSGGSTKPDWYLDIGDHRVPSKIKQ